MSQEIRDANNAESWKAEAVKVRGGGFSWIVSDATKDDLEPEIMGGSVLYSGCSRELLTTEKRRFRLAASAPDLRNLLNDMHDHFWDMADEECPETMDGMPEHEIDLMIKVRELLDYVDGETK